MCSNLGDDDGENETPEHLGEENASGFVQRLVDEKHLVLVGCVTGEKVRDAHHQNERVDDGVGQADLPGQTQERSEKRSRVRTLNVVVGCPKI